MNSAQYQLKKTEKASTMKPELDQKAEVFIKEMREHILGQNFTLQGYSYSPQHDDFDKIVNRQLAFRNFINDRLLDLSASECALCATTYIDTYQSGLVGAYALALWFFRFDEDNWFQYDNVLEKTKGYLNSATKWDDRLELRLFKGFSLKGILTEAISGPDLPVVCQL